MAVETHPNEAKILDSPHHVFPVSESRSRIVAFSHCHMLSLTVDFFKEKLLHVLDIESFVDALNVLRQYLIQLAVKFHLGEPFAHFFLADSVISQKTSGAEVEDLDIVAGFGNDSQRIFLLYV